MSSRLDVIVNQRTHLVVDRAAGRYLGAAGSNFYRNFVFPLYSPAGLTVLREFPFDHPFHTGLFVAQSPVAVAGRVGNFWGAPPLRSRDDHLGQHLGRIASPEVPRVSLSDDAARLVFQSTWLDENDQPLIDEVRTVDFRAVEDATVCEVASEKIARYGPVEYPQTKFGSIGLRVDPRLLPGAGGEILADAGRRGSAEVVHEQDSDYVAYENALGGGRRFGVFMTIPDRGVRGPWFVRGYGLALYSPTLRRADRTAAGESWTIRLRVAAYDGSLTPERVGRWGEQGSQQ